MILDKLPFKPTSILLSGTGEPLCNPHFFELVDILAGRGIKSRFFTNGTLLKIRTRDAILSRGSISAIAISCDGAIKETFEAFRVGADFDNWKQLVRDFIAESRQRRPIGIEMMSILSKQNLNEIEDIIHLAANLGFRLIRFHDAIPIDDAAASVCLSNADLSKVNEKDLYRLGKELGIKVALSWMRRSRIPPKAIVRCIQPWEYMQVLASGDVVPCCAVFGTEKLMFMGNLFHQEFKEIWNGSQFRNFRQTCASGQNALCKVCTYY
jgi:radical SAM protein with 4Fe4S-binding SPASM domain